MAIAATLVLVPGVASAQTPSAHGGDGSTPAVDSARPKIVNPTGLGSTQEFPWIAAIQKASEPDPFQAQFCGGVRVAGNKVLTAAHCVVNDVGAVTPAGALKVLIGVSDLYTGSSVPVARVAVHPLYNRSLDRNDVAVLTLAYSTPGRAAAVMTPDGGNRAAPGNVARLAGWGCDTLTFPITGDCDTYPSKLLAASLPMQPASVCEATIVHYDGRYMVCSGTVSSGGFAPDACYGDSGGPLVVRGAREPWVVGLVSYSGGCGGTPTAYARLSVVNSWLASQGVPIRPGPFLRHSLLQSVSGPTTPIAGDFSGDGRTDLVWDYPGTSTDYYWAGTASGPRPLRTSRTTPPGATAVVGDFNGDRRDDIFWYRPGTAPEALWLGLPGGAFSPRAAPQVNGTYLPLVGNFSGGSASDIIWYAPGPGAEVLWTAVGGGAFRSSSAPAVGGVYRPAVGDFDGNGYSDILWYSPDNGAERLWRTYRAGFAGFSGLQLEGGRYPVVGDFDGDRRADLMLYGPGAGMDVLWRGAPSGSSGFNRPTDVAIGGAYVTAPGDFDGDGRDDVVLYGPGAAPDSWWEGARIP